MFNILPATVILDVDGVIFDSNQLKENNIQKAASLFLNGEKLKDFVRHFTSQNGVTRQTKIAAQFGEETVEYSTVLKTYERLNEESLYSVEFTEKAQAVIEMLSKKCKLIALSGGEEREVKKLFEVKGIDSYFDAICGGPKSKKDHLNELDLKDDVWFFGDSKMDFESANHIGAKFIFLFGHTQMENWESFFGSNSNVSISYNLSTFFGLETLKK
jgi:phosphoglycolate phosphatase-like HAD superfamily hydrolase